MIALYSLALLVSAALLFLLEPMVGEVRAATPRLRPEVWPTTVLFFQLALLGVAAVLLPIGVPDASPPQSGSPVPWLLGLLASLLGG